MAYYRKCPYCGDNLDPGEICECRERELERQRQLRKRQAEATRLAEREGMWVQEVLVI